MSNYARDAENEICLVEHSSDGTVTFIDPPEGIEPYADFDEVGEVIDKLVRDFKGLKSVLDATYAAGLETASDRRLSRLSVALILHYQLKHLSNAATQLLFTMLSTDNKLLQALVE